ncbi:16S rRNA (guanine(527)-N(7))-methyltransferase RsmG [Butyricicoccus porcorum]|uniref:Ribosomal RNA small subunit methyltransferase G n=1 Tax=Butyricicoccus porcorum TaxID=1945634 RepID=A0A252F4Q2_9FIRM|nr:16S rRNA (guanine(527)-N(7))-methyltransferase RsmG [Butyricicoccus porcorum]MCI6927024.1 16S rRNA (guanine(527)-N(7))-methyltransferase RsmG [Butyricicoccus porcorum]MDD6987231.1 16S rRNA (guanine(527)-N(7))-methyltransferase RsmG [Butyricicoccus porcorum]MDY4483470.1 16S rRNA (guanine(527)-N(7))-methyltransferase RsmG [Butyricicoccus porcorum]OUM20749.1 16S rRNA (guanine(527)-N(7))-methyltransferase RsmG [Butyricicoccus porcorum]
MNELLKTGFSEMGLSVSDAQLAQLNDFTARMLETNKVMNLTGITEPEEIATKHLLDCASLLTAADFSKKSVVDVGCGAGFPGMPLHILCPDCELTLLDSLRKRILFLQSCIDGMGLTHIEAVHARAEEFAAAHREHYDFAVSRAVAQLNVLAELSLPLVKPGGMFIAMKGRDSDEELAAAKKAIAALGGEAPRVVDYTIPHTDITHRLVLIRKKKPTPKQYPRPFRKISANPL